MAEISHEEMFAALKRAILTREREAQTDDGASWSRTKDANALRTCLDHLEASRWRPIETCPEYDDGIKIIIFGGRHTKPEVCVADGGWWNSADMVGEKSRPTHWMPLPSPPTTTSEGS
jgi:hypothetical protein